MIYLIICSLLVHICRSQWHHIIDLLNIAIVGSNPVRGIDICVFTLSIVLHTGGCLCGLVIRVPGFRSRGPGSIPGATRFFWEAVGLERGPLSLVSTIEELLGRKSSGSGLENREYDRRDPSRRARGTLYPQKLALTSPTRGGHSVGIVRSRTQATEVFYLSEVKSPLTYIHFLRHSVDVRFIMWEVICRFPI
jgi:hypothetical protein